MTERSTTDRVVDTLVAATGFAVAQLGELRGALGIVGEDHPLRRALVLHEAYLRGMVDLGNHVTYDLDETPNLRGLGVGITRRLLELLTQVVIERDNNIVPSSEEVTQTVVVEDGQPTEAVIGDVRNVSLNVSGPCWDREKREITSDFEIKAVKRNKPDRPIGG